MSNTVCELDINEIVCTCIWPATGKLMGGVQVLHEALFIHSQCHRPALLSLGVADTWAWVMLCCGGVALWAVDVQRHPWPPPAR